MLLGNSAAGLGLLLMAVLTLLGHDDPREANALKNLLASVVTGVAVATFILAGVVAWGPTLPALSGTIAGGVVGARAAQRVPALWLRRAAIAIGAVLTVVFLWQAHG